MTQSQGAGVGITANKDNLFSYNKNLQPLANELRKEMTKAEACLWKYVLRSGQMNSYKFNIHGVAAEIERFIEEITSPGTPSRGGHK